MCGIVGLLVKKPALREHLGELMMPMLIGMAERGPGFGGLAVFTEPVAGSGASSACTARSRPFDWQQLRRRGRPRSSTTCTVDASRPITPC